jgi:hypothetical protein
VRVQLSVQAEQADAQRSGPAGAARSLVAEPDGDIRLDRRRPQRTAREQRLQAPYARFGHPVALLFIGSERFELRPDIPCAEPELQPPRREDVDEGRFLRDVQRVAQRCQQDRGADPQRPGPDRQGSGEGEGL